MYARAAVAVLFDKLANLGQKFGNMKDNDDVQSAFHAGKMFLLDLLDSAVWRKSNHISDRQFTLSIFCYI